MTQEEKQQLKAEMEKKCEELEQLIGELKDQTKPMTLDNSVGRVSRMDYINNKSVREQGLRKAKNDLKAIKRWLERYDEDSFGMCFKCKQPINPKRLLFLPSSTLCIRCASRS